MLSVNLTLRDEQDSVVVYTFSAWYGLCATHWGHAAHSPVRVRYQPFESLEDFGSASTHVTGEATPQKGRWETNSVAPSLKDPSSRKSEPCLTTSITALRLPTLPGTRRPDGAYCAALPRRRICCVWPWRWGSSGGKNASSDGEHSPFA